MQEKLAAFTKANLPRRGVIKKTLLPPKDQDKKTNQKGYCLNHEVSGIHINTEGIIGDRHRRILRPSTGREHQLYVRDTLIRQHRHIMDVSSHDCETLTQRLGVEINPENLGANLLIDRTDEAYFSLANLPPGTYLQVFPESEKDFKKENAVATLQYQFKQRGCGNQGLCIATQHDDKKLTGKFTAGSKEHRGAILSVETPADPVWITPGMQVKFLYSQLESR